MKKMWRKVLNFLRNLFSRSKKDEFVESVEPDGNQPLNEELLPTGPNGNEDEPTVSSKKATITSFLWKPTSDTIPYVSTISVSCDLARAEDVRIEIRDKFGRVLNANKKYNVGGVKRGNKLPKQKYGRFNFKPGPTAEQFSKSGRLKVSFYLELDGEIYPMKVMGSDFVMIKDPHQRMDLQ